MSERADERHHLCCMPSHVIYRILKILDEKSIITFSMCSKLTRDLAKSNTLWENIYNRNFNLKYLCYECADGLRLYSTPIDMEIDYKYLCVERFIKHKFWNGHIEKVLMIKDLDHAWPISKICHYNSSMFTYVGLSPYLHFYSLKHSNNVLSLITSHREPIVSMINTDFGIVCGSLDGLISLWTIHEEGIKFSNVCNIIYQHHHAVYTLSSCGSVLVSGSDDYTACIFDLESLYLIRKISYINRVRKTIITEKWILIAGLHGSIIVIDRVSSNEFTILNSRSSLVGMWVKQDTLISISRDDKIKIWNLAEKSLKLIIPTRLTTRMFYELVKFVTDDIALINDKIEGIQMICLKKYHFIHVFKKCDDKILTFDIIDRHMIAIDAKKQVSLWDLKTRKKKRVLFQIDSHKNLSNFKIAILENYLVVYGNHAIGNPKSLLYLLKLYA